MPTLAIVPTDEELDELLNAFVAAGCAVATVPGARVRRHVVENLDLELAHGGLGKNQFAVQTQYLLGQGQWNLVVCAGAAGALVDDVAIGDVVVATETIEHDIRKIGRALVPRFPGAPAAIARCRAAHWPTRLRVHLGGIASGDEDVVTADRRAECHRLTGALAVAWEGAGGARACAFAEVPYLEVRGVADQANEHGPRDFRLNLATAMRNLAQVLRVVAG